MSFSFHRSVMDSTPCDINSVKSQNNAKEGFFVIVTVLYCVKEKNNLFHKQWRDLEPIFNFSVCTRCTQI